jgi:hypothetical protein
MKKPYMNLLVTTDFMHELADSQNALRKLVEKTE